MSYFVDLSSVCLLTQIQSYFAINIFVYRRVKPDVRCQVTGDEITSLFFFGVRSNSPSLLKSVQSELKLEFSVHYH